MDVRDTRSNKPVWVAGLRAVTHGSHQRSHGGMERSHSLGEILNSSIPACERTNEVNVIVNVITVLYRS